MSNNDDIYKKLDKLDNRLDNVDKTLAAQHESLKHHIYRTKLAEKRLEHIENNLEPIKAHVNRMDGALKFLGVLSLVLGVIISILKIFGVI